MQFTWEDDGSRSPMGRMSVGAGWWWGGWELEQRIGGMQES